MVTIKLTLPVQVAVIEADGLAVTEDKIAFDRLEECATKYLRSCAEQGIGSPGGVEGVQAARSFFRAIGIDPTKTRPSSEALLRRALKGKPLHAVNTLVDLCNWCSLEFLLPIGLYDRAKILGPVTFRRGREGEQYEGIGKPPVNVAGRYVLADNVGPFGSPTSDSLRTRITTSTNEALMTIFAPIDFEQERLRANAGTAAERIVEVCGGRTTRLEVLVGPNG